MPRKGIMITEANGDFTTYPSPESQISDTCIWWKEEQEDATDYWVEQAMLYVTKVDPDAPSTYDEQERFELRDAQTLPISDCRLPRHWSRNYCGGCPDPEVCCPPLRTRSAVPVVDMR
jgi:hypothetical protein